MKKFNEMLNNVNRDFINITVNCDKDIVDNYKKVSFNNFEDVTDGYHTFKELYEYRMLYNAAFFNELYMQEKYYSYDVHKSKCHNDGKECFGGGWFIVMAELPTGQISNHYELKDWDLFKIPEKIKANKYDGHTPQEAAKRLREFLKHTYF